MPSSGPSGISACSSWSSTRASSCRCASPLSFQPRTFYSIWTSWSTWCSSLISFWISIQASTRRGSWSWRGSSLSKTTSQCGFGLISSLPRHTLGSWHYLKELASEKLKPMTTCLVLWQIHLSCSSCLKLQNYWKCLNCWELSKLNGYWWNLKSIL